MLAGVVGAALSSRIIGVLPFKWWGFASLGVAGLAAVYVGIESKALFGDPDDDHDPGA